MFRNILLINILLFQLLSANAQKERIDDLIPYKSKGKWGIVHHDKKPFYDPVFDSIVYFNWSNSVFKKDPYGDSVAEVLFHDDIYLITRSKKLINKEEYIKSKGKAPDTEEENTVFSVMSQPVSSADINIDDEIEYAKDKIYESSTGDKWFKTESGKKIQIKKINKDYKHTYYKVFINGNYIKDLDCIDFNKYGFTDEATAKGRYNSAIIKGYTGVDNDNYYYGYADFENEKLVLPYQYEYLEYCMQNPDWFLTHHEILDKKGKFIGKSFKEIRDIAFPFKGSHNPFFIVQDSSEQYRFYYPLNDSLSPVTYSALSERFDSPSSYQFYKVDELIFHAEKNYRRHGVVGPDDKILVSIKYPGLEFWGNDEFATTASGNKSGFVNLKDSFFCKEPEYDKIQQEQKLNFTVNKHSYFVFLVEKNGAQFFVDDYGKEFVDPNDLIITPQNDIARLPSMPDRKSGFSSEMAKIFKEGNHQTNYTVFKDVSAFAAKAQSKLYDFYSDTVKMKWLESFQDSIKKAGGKSIYDKYDKRLGFTKEEFDTLAALKKDSSYSRKRSYLGTFYGGYKITFKGPDDFQEPRDLSIFNFLKINLIDTSIEYKGYKLKPISHEELKKFNLAMKDIQYLYFFTYPPMKDLKNYNSYKSIYNFSILKDTRYDHYYYIDFSGKRDPTKENSTTFRVFITP